MVDIPAKTEATITGHNRSKPVIEGMVIAQTKFYERGVLDLLNKVGFG